MAGYDFTAIEAKWQKYWDEHGTFRQANPGEAGFQRKPKLYVLDMFPYPSGAGLHVGHPEGYTASDIVARYGRMKGYNVLHPMGYDAFGLPAEQYAVEHGVHPRVTTERNIANIERQIRMFGFSYDWSRRVATIDPDYYRWTQWIFLKMFNSWYDREANAARPIDELIHKLQSGHYVVDLNGGIAPAPAGGLDAVVGLPPGLRKLHELAPHEQRAVIDGQRLAYVAEVPVNWCPMLGTVLANEEVTNEGRSERGDYPVYRRAMKQWMLRITAYADRLLTDIDLVDWPEPIKIMQRNWIGKSSGANVLFDVCTTGVSPVSLFEDATSSRAHRPLLSGKSFKGMNPYPGDVPKPTDIIEHIRNLPHVKLPGGTYFVTFGLMEGETLAEQERDIVLSACKYWHGKRCCLSAIVIMDDHVHMILRPYEGHSLSELLHGIKSYTAHEMNKRRNRTGALWNPESFDHIVRDGWWFTKFIYYICENPVKRKLAQKPNEYPWLWVNADEVVTVPEGKALGNSNAAEGACESSQGTSEKNGNRRDACCTLKIFTTRPDTLFGATYMVLAPEHPLVDQITTDQQRNAVGEYVRQAAQKSELERTAETKEKTGVFTGAYAINPVNNERISVWIADYVMMGYGTGAIMAVPAHDTRDLEFAEKYDLRVVQVVQPPEGVDWRGYVGEGVAINSGKYDGLRTPEFVQRITKDLEKAAQGENAVNYKLRDWLFSRQRYWGEPFPIVHCENCGAVALPEDELPLVLPEMDDFAPEASDDPNAPPRPPLGKATGWIETTCPACGKPAKRELNTMPQWAGSCWYYLRYLDSENADRFCGQEAESYWMGSGGVDLYVGGAEHAVLHLLYARFWHKVLYDLGYVSTLEPFGKLFNQGMIRSFAYRDQRGVYVGYDDVDLSGEAPRHRETGEALAESVEKMSKSLKNVINPDDVIAQHGADTFRLYEMFMGPLEASKPWNTRDVPGVHRFLHRVWRLIDPYPSPAGYELIGRQPYHVFPGNAHVVADKVAYPKLERTLHQLERALHVLIKKVSEDIDAMKFNTAIAAMMEFLNKVGKSKDIPERPDGTNRSIVANVISKSQFERFVLVLAPFAPHIAEEIWQRLGHAESLAHEAWPEYDEAMIAEETIELPVQVNGKVRGRVRVAADADEEAIVAAVLADERIQSNIAGKEVVKKILVPGRLVNLVVK